MVYAGILNKGYRAVTVNGWRLHLRARNGKRAELRALSMPQPEYKLGEITKVFPVLGQKGVLHDGGMRVEAGDSMSGMALYVYECFGPEDWNPAMKDQWVTGRFSVGDVFGGRTSCSIQFRERSFADIEKVIPGLKELFVAVDAGWAG